TRAVICLPVRLGSGPSQIDNQSRLVQSLDGYRRRLRGIRCFRSERAERMSETATLESIGRRLDGLQNNVSGLNRRMVTLESNLIDRVAALEARNYRTQTRAAAWRQTLKRRGRACGNSGGTDAPTERPTVIA